MNCAIRSCYQVSDRENSFTFSSFSYPDGSIITNSGFVWNAHSGATGQTEVVSSMLELRGSQSEDINRLIPGQPYDSTSDLTLYAGLTVKFSTLPSTGGDYFAHFKDSANGYAARLFASTANAASGQFRLGIANGTGTQVEFPQDLALNTTHGVVIGYDLVTGQSRFWVNPVNEASTSVQDLSSASPIVVTSFAFRQSGGIGSLDVDDLCVGNGFVAVIPTISPGGIPLEAAREGNDLILSWSNPAFTLLTGTNVTGVTNPVLGATSPYTNSIADPTRYFRLIMQ